MTKARFRNVTGESIRKCRLNRAWTQDVLAAKLQLAGLVHIDRVMLAKIETNIRSVYDYELVVIAEVFGVPIADLCPSGKLVKKEMNKLLSGVRSKFRNSAN